MSYRAITPEAAAKLPLAEPKPPTRRERQLQLLTGGLSGWSGNSYLQHFTYPLTPVSKWEPESSWGVRVIVGDSYLSMARDVVASDGSPTGCCRLAPVRITQEKKPRLICESCGRILGFNRTGFYRRGGTSWRHRTFREIFSEAHRDLDPLQQELYLHMLLTDLDIVARGRGGVPTSWVEDVNAELVAGN